MALLLPWLLLALLRPLPSSSNHWYRRCDRRLLPHGWCDLPSRLQQRPQEPRHSLFRKDQQVVRFTTSTPFALVSSSLALPSLTGSIMPIAARPNSLTKVLSPPCCLLCSPRPFTLIARKGSGISSFEDLQGKKVNVGNPGSGQRATMEVVMESFGMKMSDFALAAELKGSIAQAICDGKSKP